MTGGRYTRLANGHAAQTHAAAPVPVADTSGRGTLLTPDGGIIHIPDHLDVSPDDIRGMQITNAQLSGMTHLGHEPSADMARDQGLTAAVDGFASRMGLGAPPEIVVQPVGGGRLADLPYIGSGFTREGRPYIQINAAMLGTLAPEQLKAAMAFEVDRLRNGDATPEHMAATLNDQSIAFADTFRADRAAAGPLGVNNPRVFRETLEKGDQIRRDALARAGASDLRDPEHPPLIERSGYLRMMERDQGNRRSREQHRIHILSRAAKAASNCP